ncbi:hypothetical protein [Sphingomonas corticis]|uniref:Uncharacterized protein n=1 Tax=Sphingomonas corticis TaxID=2722791 RepID=A0ABX1CQ57_9SPHN|nr:hypothetical protein [Sphingomonas corticis]NJR79396.1 hypothetical protein [Sphingomonas corticis]
MVSGGAFKPRPADDGALSVNRCGVFSNDPDDDLATIRDVVGRWMTTRATGRLLQIVADSIGAVLADTAAKFWLEEDPRSGEGLPDDPSHALVHGIPTDESDGSIAIRDMIAMKVTAVHAGKNDVPA